MVLDAVGANMNMLRVWGGGAYPRDDVFLQSVRCTAAARV